MSVFKKCLFAQCANIWNSLGEDEKTAVDSIAPNTRIEAYEDFEARGDGAYRLDATKSEWATTRARIFFSVVYIIHIPRARLYRPLRAKYQRSRA